MIRLSRFFSVYLMKRNCYLYNVFVINYNSRYFNLLIKLENEYECEKQTSVIVLVVYKTLINVSICTPTSSLAQH